MKRIFSFIAGVIVLFIMRCGNTSPPDAEVIKRDSIHEIKKARNYHPLNLSYHLLPMDSFSRSWLHSVSGDTLTILLALNRIDKKHILLQDTLVMPDTLVTDLKFYSPFPPDFSGLRSIHKIILFSYPLEAFAAYESGMLVRWGPVSMGKASTPTPTGLFHANWKSKQTISTVNEEWIMNWYVNLENFLGISMHEYALPGYPASHSCIRLLDHDAYWLYHWIDQWILESDTEIAGYGTPVLVFGKNDFGKRKSLRILTTKNKLPAIQSEELLQNISEFMPLIIQRQVKRDTLLIKVF